MPDKTTIDYATPTEPKPIKWGMVTLPLFIAAWPIAIAFLAFSLGIPGLGIAACALCSGYILSPVAATLSIINCFKYRHNPWAVALSLSTTIAAIAALCYEIWRMHGQ